VWSEVGGIAHQRSLLACSGKVNNLKLKLTLPHRPAVNNIRSSKSLEAAESGARTPRVEVYGLR
jgi:hypothetical protein